MVETSVTAKDSAPLPKTVVTLGWVSFLTDVASEMIVSLLPAFLSSLGTAPALALGWIEGVAESTSAAVKIGSGRISDRLARRKPLVVFGYSVSALARPLIGFATLWPAILAIRFLDRIGKGVRSAPRDALIAEVTPPERRGAAYGLHRAFDNAGAVLGPLLAAALLGFFDVPLRTVFLLSAVPGLIGVFVLVRFVKEMPREKTIPAGQKLAPLPPGFWKALVPMGLFALAASSDTFLLLRAREVGFAAAALPLLWAFSNAIRSALGHWGGGLSDRIGRRRTLLLAFCLYAATYAAFAHVDQQAVFVLVLALYSVHAALSEGAEKALVASLVPPESRGRAFGLFHGLTAFCALPASVGFGWLFERVSSRSAYLTGAALATLAAISLLALVRSEACRDPSGNA